MALSLNFGATVAKNVQKALDILAGSSVFIPSIANECIGGPVVDFWGIIIVKDLQNLFGLPEFLSAYFYSRKTWLF